MYPESVGQSMEEPAPRLYLDDDCLPDVKEWMTGGEYTIVLRVKQVSSHLKHDDKVEVCLEAIEAKSLGSKKRKSYPKDVLESMK